MSSQRLERLVLLMDHLIDTTRPLSAAEIRVQVPGYPEGDSAFKRQFERDKEELREMGVPLVMEEIFASDPPVVGYRIPRQLYELQDPGLEPDELEALNLAAAVVGFTGGLGRRAMFKLGGGASPVAQRTEVGDDPNLNTVFSAVVTRQRIGFGYRNKARELDPYRLQFARGRWYLNGLDHEHGDRRWYRMSRIDGRVTLQGDPSAFAQPAPGGEDLQLDPWMLATDVDPVEAEVWFDPVAAAGVREDLSGTDIVSDDETGLVARLTVHNRDGFRSWVLSFLERAEVLSPPELRDEMVEWLQAIIDGGER